MLHTSSNIPLISIVTVVLNGADQIEKTLHSVINQSYNNVEYIIIDGASTDRTLDIIDRYKEHIAKVVSEPDGGIYDAMNKAFDHASGEWINFMNCGDTFYSGEIISDIFKGQKIEADIIYGDTQFDYGNGYRRLMKAGRLEHLWKGMRFYHQSTFMRTAIAKENKFDQRYVIVADYDLLYKLQQKGNLFQYTDRVVSIMATGGLSYVCRAKAFAECHAVVRKHSRSIKVEWHYFKLICMTRLNFAVRYVIPQWAFLLTLRIKDKIAYAGLFIRLGGAAQMIPLAVALLKELLRRSYSDDTFFGFYADLTPPPRVIESKIPVRLRQLRESDIPHLFNLRDTYFSPADLRALLLSLNFAFSRIPKGYVGVTAEEEPCAVCWRLSSASNAHLEDFFHRGLPALQNNEAFCEFLFIPPRFRRNRLMGWITTSIWQIAAQNGFTRAIAYVNKKNRMSLEISREIGWQPFGLKHVRWRMFKRHITFNNTHDWKASPSPAVTPANQESHKP